MYTLLNAPLAQMYRANRYERLGQGLESLMEYNKLQRRPSEWCKGE